MTRAALTSSLAALALAVACGEGGAEEAPRGPGDAPASVTLDLAAFAPSAPLFSDEGAPIVACSAGGVIAESGALEVRTALCDPADVAIPLPELTGAERLRGTLTHDALVADGGVGHVALTLDGAVVWELEVAIPSPAGYFLIDAPLPGERAADESVRAVLGLHVHNHGANAWRVRDLVIARE